MPPPPLLLKSGNIAKFSANFKSHIVIEPIRPVPRRRRSFDMVNNPKPWVVTSGRSGEVGGNNSKMVMLAIVVGGVIPLEAKL